MQFSFHLNFKEIVTGICGCLLLNFAEMNGYNIILLNIISKTHAGHAHRSARKNRLGSFTVER